ncbi:unnamed protein product [Alopecurus aequalis]
MAQGEEEGEKIVAGAGDDEEKQIVLVGAGSGDNEEQRIVPVAGAGGSDEEEKRIVLVGTGDEEMMMRRADKIFPPPGFRFQPMLDELVMYYLLPKLQGKEHVPNDNIIEDNVYQCHPDKLIEKYKDRGEDSWYFLSARARKYTNGNRPSRSTEDKRGRWKASTGKKKVEDEENGGTTTKSCPSTVVKVAGDGKTTYTRSTLAYFEGPIKREKKSKWLMKELTVPQYEKKRDKNGGGGGKVDTLDQYVMCRIYVTKRHKGDDDEAGPSGTQSEPAESGQAATDGRAKLSEKQAGKRPAEEQPLGKASKRAHHPNPDRLHLGPPAPPHGNGMRPPFMTPGYCDGGPGLPMGHYGRPPMPRPPVMYHNGQGPVASNGQAQVPRPPVMYHNGQGPAASNSQAQVPRQAVACNGQGPRPPVMYHNGQGPAASNSQAQVPRQQVACNGQGPLPRQQAAYNSQVPMQRQTVGFNVQVPVPLQQVGYDGKVMRGAVRAPTLKLSPPFRPAGTPSPCGQNQTMMPRPQYPARQAAVNPPSSGVPRPAQTRTQPETEEMRAKRVYHQHMQEYMRMNMMQSSTRPPASAAHAAQQQQRPMAFTHQQQQQQQPTMAFMQHHQRPMMAPTQHHQQQHQQQQPYFGANAYGHHHAGAMAPHQFSLENFHASEAAQQHHERSQMVLPATSGTAGAPAECLVTSAVSGAGGAVSGANRDHSDDDIMEFVESATEGGSASAADGDGPKYDSAQ